MTSHICGSEGVEFRHAIVVWCDLLALAHEELFEASGTSFGACKAV